MSPFSMRNCHVHAFLRLHFYVIFPANRSARFNSATLSPQAHARILPRSPPPAHVFSALCSYPRTYSRVRTVFVHAHRSPSPIPYPSPLLSTIPSSHLTPSHLPLTIHRLLPAHITIRCPPISIPPPYSPSREFGAFFLALCLFSCSLSLSLSLSLARAGASARSLYARIYCCFLGIFVKYIVVGGTHVAIPCCSCCCCCILLLHCYYLLHISCRCCTYHVIVTCCIIVLLTSKIQNKPDKPKKH